jgi:hypothetical protein
MYWNDYIVKSILWNDWLLQTVMEVIFSFPVVFCAWLSLCFECECARALEYVSERSECVRACEYESVSGWEHVRGWQLVCSRAWELVSVWECACVCVCVCVCVCASMCGGICRHGCVCVISISLLEHRKSHGSAEECLEDGLEWLCSEEHPVTWLAVTDYHGSHSLFPVVFCARLSLCCECATTALCVYGSMRMWDYVIVWAYDSESMGVLEHVRMKVWGRESEWECKSVRCVCVSANEIVRAFERECVSMCVCVCGHGWICVLASTYCWNIENYGLAEEW